MALSQSYNKQRPPGIGIDNALLQCVQHCGRVIQMCVEAPDKRPTRRGDRQVRLAWQQKQDDCLHTNCLAHV